MSSLFFTTSEASLSCVYEAILRSLKEEMGNSKKKRQRKEFVHILNNKTNWVRGRSEILVIYLKCLIFDTINTPHTY